jgi:transposase
MGGRTGRPEKLTAAVETRVVDAIRAGASREKAAQAAGVSRSTLQNWLVRGQEPKPPVKFQKFVAAFREAEVAAYLASVESIRQAADSGDWRAAAFMLERRHRDEFARSAAEQSEQSEQGWVHHDFSALTDRELDQLQALLAKVKTRRVGAG